MDLVVVLDPSGDLPKRSWRVRQGADANVVALEGFDEGLGEAVRFRAGLKHGTKLSAAAKSLVSLAV